MNNAEEKNSAFKFKSNSNSNSILTNHLFITNLFELTIVYTFKLVNKETITVWIPIRMSKDRRESILYCILINCK